MWTQVDATNDIETPARLHCDQSQTCRAAPHITLCVLHCHICTHTLCVLHCHTCENFIETSPKKVQPGPTSQCVCCTVTYAPHTLCVLHCQDAPYTLCCTCHTHVNFNVTSPEKVRPGPMSHCVCCRVTHPPHSLCVLHCHTSDNLYVTRCGRAARHTMRVAVSHIHLIVCMCRTVTPPTISMSPGYGGT